MLQPRQSSATSTPWAVLSGVEMGFRVSIDPNGNLTSDGTNTYFWDAADRLIEVKQGAATLASFTYDGSGRRATKTTSGSTITYVYDGANFLEERPTVGSTRRYVYGAAVDQPLAQVTSGTVTYNIADHLGSLVRTTDNGGAPISALDRHYDPWGNPMQGSATSGYAFTGREWDAETGLYYYRARYYYAPSGRFVSEDPIGTEGGANRYAYVTGNPVRFTDPSGEVKWECGYVIGAAGGGVVMARCESACTNHKRVTAKYLGSVLGFGLSLTFDAKIEDPFGEPNGLNLEGRFATVSASAGVPGLRVKVVSALVMGDAWGVGGPGVSFSGDPTKFKPGAGLGGFAGATAMLSQREECCN